MDLPQRQSKPLGVAVLLAGLILWPQPSTAEQHTRGVLYGFTAFPYDFTTEAEQRLNELIAANANLYAIHMDQCVPWAEALADTAFPAWLEESWRKDKARISSHQVTYVAVTPTAMDRHSLAPQCGAREGSKGQIPRALLNSKYGDATVKRAYVNFVKRVVMTFNPKFLNIGIEISELALRHPQDWPGFENLFLHTYREIKQAYPNIQIGIEMGLQSLLAPKVAALVKPAVEASDYLGISFYPYTSAFGEFFGAPRLPPPPEQWRAALEWLRTYTTKPIAICETGYSTEALLIREGPGLPVTGDALLQKAFLEDLIQIAVRDEYLFVVWFVLVDYTKLLATMPDAQEWMRIWVHAGLFTPTLQPKPAWAAWMLWMQQNRPPVDTDAATAAAIAPAPSSAGPPQPAARPAAVGLLAALRCSGDSALQASSDGPRDGMSSALWTVRHTRDWALCQRHAAPPPGARGVRLWIRSDQSDFVLVHLQERSGEAFFELVPAGPEWREIRVPFVQFKLDPQNRRDGRLQPGQIEALALADGAGAEGATGSRSYWIAELGFYE